MHHGVFRTTTRLISGNLLVQCENHTRFKEETNNGENGRNNGSKN